MALQLRLQQLEQVLAQEQQALQVESQRLAQVLVEVQPLGSEPCYHRPSGIA